MDGSEAVPHFQGHRLASVFRAFSPSSWCLGEMPLRLFGAKEERLVQRYTELSPPECGTGFP